jgi:hypothetical protein
MPLDGTYLDETTQVILRARDLLAKGWCTGSRQNGMTFCALGALAYVATGNANRDSALYRKGYERLESSLTDAQREEAQQESMRQGFGRLHSRQGLVAQYNNSQTSVEPILEWFDKAAMLVSG